MSFDTRLALRIAGLTIGVVVLALLIWLAAISPGMLSAACFSFVFAWVWACLGILVATISLGNSGLRWLGAVALGLGSMFMIVAAFGSSDHWEPPASIVFWFEVAMAFTLLAVAFGNDPSMDAALLSTSTESR